MEYEEVSVIEQKYNFFWDYFVPGAPAFITENLNTTLGLANGTSILCHSLSFFENMEYDLINKLITEQENNFGNFVTLPFPPASVNICVCGSIDNKPITSKRQKQLDFLNTVSILATDTSANDIPNIIIPLPLSKSSMDKTKAFKFILKNNLHSHLAQIIVNDQFPFELGFAMTNHKCQGRTMTHVILALTSRPTKQMEFAAIYVAMSRVKCRENIRLLIHNNADINESFKYISNLHANPFVLLFYAGFGNQNNTFWNCDMALQHFKPSLSHK
jgi:Helicase